MYRLAFTNYAVNGRLPKVIEGETATEVLDQWNDGPWLKYLSPTDFRKRIVASTGAAVDPASADDDEVLKAVVSAAPEIELTRFSPLAAKIREALAQVGSE